MIEIKDLTFAYGGQPPIFENFNWRVPAGEAWSVIGPSGCGKTTLLYLIAGLRRPIAKSPKGRPINGWIIVWKNLASAICETSTPPNFHGDNVSELR